ncbi:MAG: hypothetical protein ACREXP_03280 [Steroidobacteraceae bacterium]
MCCEAARLADALDIEAVIRAAARGVFLLVAYFFEPAHVIGEALILTMCS